MIYIYEGFFMIILVPARVYIYIRVYIYAHNLCIYIYYHYISLIIIIYRKSQLGSLHYIGWTK